MHVKKQNKAHNLLVNVQRSTPTQKHHTEPAKTKIQMEKGKKREKKTPLKQTNNISRLSTSTTVTTKSSTIT